MTSAGLFASWDPPTLPPGTPGVDAGVLDDGSAIAGGDPGIQWSAPVSESSSITSQISLGNGVSQDSLFIGNLSLTDPAADIVGTDLLISIQEFTAGR